MIYSHTVTLKVLQQRKTVSIGNSNVCEEVFFFFKKLFLFIGSFFNLSTEDICGWFDEWFFFTTFVFLTAAK